MTENYVRLVALNGKPGTCAVLLMIANNEISSDPEVKAVIDEGPVPTVEGERHIHTLEALVNAGYTDTHCVAQINVNKTEYKRWLKKVRPAAPATSDEPAA